MLTDTSGMEQDLSPIASTSRLGLCSACSVQVALYRCPRCSFPSCSLKCSTSHKVSTSCTGVAAPVWSKPLLANELNWGSLMRDHSYLSGVSRLAEEMGRELVQNGLIPEGSRTRYAETDEATGSGTRLDDMTDKEARLVREARREGVRLLLLPKGMSRRAKNASKWDHKYVANPSYHTTVFLG